MHAPAHAAAKLVQLRQAEPFGILNQHQGGVGNVHADFDHTRADQNIEFAGGEGAHHLVLFGAPETAVEEPDAQIGEDLLAQTGMGVHRCADIQRFTLFDEWIDDIALAAVTHLPPQKTVEAFPIRGLEPLGFDRRPARGHFVDDTHIEVAVNGERETARDWRGAHYEQMGDGVPPALVTDGCPLADAKAVLLVDHDKAEVGELHILLDERGGADHNLNAAVCQAGESGFPFLSGHAPGQESDMRRFAAGQPDVFQQVAQPATVLLRQDLGGRQQGGLEAVGCGDQHGPGGHHGLAAADVALHQAAHRHAPLHIPLQFIQRPLLGAGQGKGQG